MSKQSFTIRLEERERSFLNQLAHETGRTRGEIIRRLLVLATTPTGREALGMIPSGKEGGENERAN